MRAILATLIALPSAALAGGLLDGIAWPGAALALFRPQLALAAAALSLLALLVGPRRWALAGLAAAALGGALLVPALREPEPQPPPAGAEPVRLLVLNLWHRNDDAEAVAGLIRRERPDVVALVELTPAWQRALAPALREYAARVEAPTRGSSGVGLYGRSTLAEPALVRLAAGARPAAEGRLDLAGGPARLLVVHPVSSLLPGDASAHEDELAAIGRWARDAGPRALVCGDLNAAPWSASVRDALDEGDLRPALPGGPLAGSWPGVPPPLRIPVDGCLAGEGLRLRASLGPRVGSDHLPVLVELA